MPKKKSKKVVKGLPVRCVWGLICSMSSIDQKTNNISLFNVIENFNVPKGFFKKNKELITIFAPYQVILFLRRLIDVNISDDEILLDLRYKAINPEGVTLVENISSFKFLGGKQSMRISIDMQAIVVNIPGLYLNKIEIKRPEDDDFVEILELPFQVISL